jgi:hypothetical protein
MMRRSMIDRVRPDDRTNGRSVVLSELDQARAVHPCNGRRSVSVSRIMRWRAGLLGTILFACASHVEAQHVQRGSRMIQLPAGARLLHTQSATVGEPEQRIVRTRAEWATLWASLYAGMPAPPLPSVDFARDVVVFATLGSRPTGGFDLDVVGTRRAGDDLDVVLVETVPAPDCMQTQAESAPTVAARIARVHGTMRFVVQRRTSRC